MDTRASIVDGGMSMAVSGTEGSSGAHAHGAAKGGSTSASNRSSERAPKKTGETTPPKDQATGSAANVGARPSPTGSEGATQARNGAHATGAHGAAGHANQVPAGTSNLRSGSTGPIVPEGQAATIRIPDGRGFGGEKGRTQNADDRKQNNYSVTDANFNPALGLMAKDPDTGKDMTYVQHIQTYNAAGYVKTFAPDTARRLQQAQDEGAGMFLEGSAYLMGLTRTQPAFLNAYGITGADIPTNIPGTNRSARQYVRDGQDATGQDWARMHHPESAWDMYRGLVGIGVDGEQALRLAGDDGVSGAGRLNGQNNQDGGNGFNAGEVEVWKQAARLQQQTGLPIIQTMMAGHDHNHLDASALTNPSVNARLGITGRDASPARAQAIFEGLLAGRLDEPRGGGGSGGGRAAAAAAGDAIGGTNGAITVDTTALQAALLGGRAPADEAELLALLQQALAYLEQAAPDVFAQLVAAQAQGIIDPALAAGVVLGLFDQPAFAAVVPPQELAATEQGLTLLQVGRAGVDPRIPALVAPAGGAAGAAIATSAGAAAPTGGGLAPAASAPIAGAAAGAVHVH